ncbi:hypothetical protein ACPWT1_12335 [Ramlibacter sp. MMS24-I3-19]|uniref:hypothetical protein n=1 Tax=Ramlibacter sp. MMS24-I3-19 TaxID=3416606 RepID=UPI003D052A8F
MSVLSAPERVPVHPQPRTRIGVATQAARGTPAAIQQSKPNCGQCGRAWFGEVDYCPYCGQRSTVAAANPRADARPAAPPQAAVPPVQEHEPATAAGPLADEPSLAWKLPWKPIVAIAAALAAGVIALLDLPALTTGGRVVAPQAAELRAPGAVAPPVAEPQRPPLQQPPSPAPPAPRRSLCSAASEAAGLCTPQ